MALRKIMLDTNAYSALVKGDDKILSLIKAAEEVYLPSFVVAELYYGFKKGNKEQWNLDILAKFENYPKVLRQYPKDDTLSIFAELLIDLKRIGRPIPTNDVWIAASAIEIGAVLITYDKHFGAIAKLRRWEG